MARLVAAPAVVVDLAVVAVVARAAVVEAQGAVVAAQGLVVAALVAARPVVVVVDPAARVDRERAVTAVDVMEAVVRRRIANRATS